MYKYCIFAKDINMEDITKSEEHRRNNSGQVIINSKESDKDSTNYKMWQLNERSFWIAAASFICVFSFMVILLAVTMSGRSTMAAKLNDMTELYNYQSTIQQQTQYQEPETATVCGECESNEPKAYYRVYRFVW